MVVVSSTTRIASGSEIVGALGYIIMLLFKSASVIGTTVIDVPIVIVMFFITASLIDESALVLQNHKHINKRKQTLFIAIKILVLPLSPKRAVIRCRKRGTDMFTPSS